MGGRLLETGLLTPAPRRPIPRQHLSGQPGTNALPSAPRCSELPHAPDLLLPRPWSSVVPRQRVAGGAADALAGRPGLQHHDSSAAPLAGAPELGAHRGKRAALPEQLPKHSAASTPGAGRDL